MGALTALRAHLGLTFGIDHREISVEASVSDRPTTAAKHAPRFSAEAARSLRAAVAEAGGVEIFAIGEVAEGRVIAVTVACRGTYDRVPALLDRAVCGQVVIHNHPSGDLRPSEPDLALADLYGDDGIGVVIVDSEVMRSNWVVEPWQRPRVAVDPDRVRSFFERDMPLAMPAFEPRAEQLQMALQVAEILSSDQPLLCEAGTGTGKTLAYLVPAALWALTNRGRVVVSTFTKTLQSQLQMSDIPALARGGLTVRAAVLQGRNNYLCRRRLALAKGEAEEALDPENDDLQMLSEWSASSASGVRSELPVHVEGELWERVLSDSDLTLSISCPHYAACHYYRARREAAASQILVVNHALLLADLALREREGRGFLPKYERIIIDEAHHLEAAATSVSTERLSQTALRRAISSLLDQRRRTGALTRLVRSQCGPKSSLPAAEQAELRASVEIAERRLPAASAGCTLSLQQLALLSAANHGEERAPKRLTRSLVEGELYASLVVPSLRALSYEIARAVESLEAIDALFLGLNVPESEIQPLLDLRRSRRKLLSLAKVAEDVLGRDEGWVYWIEPEPGKPGEETAAVGEAPIEVGDVLRRILWDPFPQTIATSATLTVAGRFEHTARRVGLPEDPPQSELILPSPFDHYSQALLGLPRDLPPPEDPRFLAESAAVVCKAVEISDGGAFVLCTSYAAVGHYATALRKAGSWPVLAQGDAGRDVLLERFRESRRSVLVGTDTFWEGISIRGDGLRLVIIPRVPFRVPTEPLLEARCERLAERGLDPFRSYTLPEAVLKLRQGYGRLIRSKTDRGAVLLLDRRIQEMPYGTILLRSLPPARRITGPWQRVREALEELYEG